MRLFACGGFSVLAAPVPYAAQVPVHEHGIHGAAAAPSVDRLRASPAAPAPRPPRTLEVGEGRDYASIASALSSSADGDTIVVAEGRYRERPVVSTPVILEGRGRVVIDGGGSGTVLTVTAPAILRGLTILGSGADQSREDAGILVLAADGVTIENNRIEDVLFGVYVKQSDGTVIRGNEITGKALPVPRRGDGIRLWYCVGGRVEENRVRRVRDVVIWFSRDLTVRRNIVTDGRYGLHYMYSDHNRFEENVFRSNHVGAFLMYSTDIRFRGNRFLEAFGASGIGLGLKDSDDIDATDNAFVGNAVGIFLDNSPSSVGSRNRFAANLIALNRIGIALLPSVHSNSFRQNAFVDNGLSVTVSGGGDALANEWSGNHWSRYAGFDRDGDGIGDSPFRHERLADDLMARYPEVGWFAFSPAISALEVLARVFPFLKPQPVVVDSSPRMRLPEWARSGASGRRSPPLPARPASSRTGDRRAAGALWGGALLAAAVLVVLVRPRRARA